MSTPATPSSPHSAGDDRNLVATDATPAVTFEDQVRLFWEKNRSLLLGLCALVLLGIIAKGGWDYMARQKEAEIGAAYAAATTSEQLKAFAASHSGHVLAGISQLRLADEAYAANKAADAIGLYDQALGTLKTGPLAARAKLGRAIAKTQAGKAAEATTDLKQIADDTALPKSVRSEAAYNLTSLAVDAGNAADAQKFVDQLNQLDPMGPWAQRALALRATLPATAAPAAASTTDAAVQVKLPGK